MATKRAAGTKSDPKWYVVPAGTTPSECGGKQKGGSCTATVFWITYPRKKPKPGMPDTVRNPIDCAVDGGSEPTATSEGMGVSHYSTCPDAGIFHR